MDTGGGVIGGHIRSRAQDFPMPQSCNHHSGGNLTWRGTPGETKNQCGNSRMRLLRFTAFSSAACWAWVDGSRKHPKSFPRQAKPEIKAVNLKSRILELPHWFFVSPGVPLQCQISAGMMIARLWHWKICARFRICLLLLHHRCP